MRVCTILLMIIMLSSCSAQLSSSEVAEFSLSTESLDTYEVIIGGPLLRPTDPSSHYYEKVINIPEGYEFGNSYNISLQQHQTAYHRFLADTAARNSYFDYYSDQSFDNMKQTYTTDTVDCIASLCTVKDSTGKRFVLFDAGNDEDFSNDVPQEFHSRRVPYPEQDTSYEFLYTDGEVEYEYYDGHAIQVGRQTLRIQPVEMADQYLVRSSANGQFGDGVINGEQYKVGLINDGDLEFTKYDELWVDVNQNGKYDRLYDHYEQLYLPFTIGDRSYVLAEIDRFGTSLRLQACDPDSIPPIGVGLTAPDFQETTIDSVEFHFSDLAGQYILLDFWTCSGPSGLFRFHTIYKSFQDDERIAFVTVGPYTPERFTPELKDIPITWPHVHGLFDVDARTLYQVAGENVTFLIDPDGIIRENKTFMPAEEMIELVESYLN